MSETNGVVLIFKNENDQVQHVSHNFETQAFGSFSLVESQQIQCRRNLARDFAIATMGNIGSMIDLSTCERIVMDLVREGWYIQTHYVGHEESSNG